MFQITVEFCPDPRCADHDETMYYTTTELPYLPPIGMFVDVGRSENGDMHGGEVIRHKLDLNSKETRICVCVKCATELRLHDLAVNNGWLSLDAEHKLKALAHSPPPHSECPMSSHTPAE